MKVEVTLYTEQFCTAVVDAPEDANDQVLTQLVLAKCDEGTTVWVTHVGWVDRQRWMNDDETYR